MTQLTSFMTSLQHLIHFHILIKSCLSVLEIIKLNKSDVQRYIEYVHSAVVYQKYLTRLEEMIIFSRQGSKIINSPNLVSYFSYTETLYTCSLFMRETVVKSIKSNDSKSLNLNHFRYALVNCRVCNLEVPG